MRLLRRIPARYRKGTIYTDSDLMNVDTAYGMDETNDAYHAVVDVVGRYASMSDIGEYVKSQRPDADMSCWSMSQMHGGGVKVTLNDDSQMLLGQDIIKSLEKDHISSRTIEICEESWRIEIPYDDVEWLEKVMPCYVTKIAIKKVFDARMVHAISQDQESLEDSVSGRGSGYDRHPDFMGFLADALALARRKGLGLYAHIID